jgi:hypothetical protein
MLNYKCLNRKLMFGLPLLRRGNEGEAVCMRLSLQAIVRGFVLQ